MNRLITARTFAASVLHEIQENGLSRGGWLKDTILNARIELMRAPEHGMQPDHGIMELKFAADAVASRNELEAIASLKLVVGSLTLAIESGDKERVERLVSSVYPWTGK